MKFLIFVLLVISFPLLCHSTANSIPTPTQIPSETPPYPLDQAQLDWGKAQIQQMLKDRPEMAPYVREGNDLWNWTVAEFAGAFAYGGVEWESGDPQGDWDSIAGKTNPKISAKKYFIRNSSNYAVNWFHAGKPKTGPVLWWETILELSNLRSRPLFDAIDAEGIAGRIGRTDYAFEYMAVEYIVTCHYAHDIYYSVWVPNCKKLNLPPMDKDFVGRFGPAVGDGCSKESFLRSFKDLDTNDFANHYRWYVSIYNKYAPEFFTKRGRPIPPAEPSSEVEQKFLDQILPLAPSGKVGAEVKKATEDIPPPP